jgi:hypothetical protein
MLAPKKDFFVMIHMPVELVSLGMSYFLKISPSFAPNSLQYFLLYLFYHVFLSRQHQYNGLTLFMFIIDALLLLILLQVSLRFLHIFLQHLILFCPFPMIPLLFVKALDLTNLLKGMVFQLLWLCLLLCLLFPFPLVINRLENMSAGNKQWRLNFMHLRPIILGTLFLVLHMSSPLVASGFIL